MGFKSAFSLGDRVELSTPTLTVLFRRDRFTEPHWLAERPVSDGRTRISVVLKDRERTEALRANFEEWRTTLASLLFFHHVRSLRIGDEELRWSRIGPGPVAKSQWFIREGSANEPVILIRSEELAFPREALEEIREERLLPGDEDGLSHPAFTIDLVLGLPGTLYAVLPAGVQTNLPFAVNAPFLQDPARVKIKDPAVSPTNRWLLQEAGHCAGEGLMAWLGSEELDLPDRAAAYRLLPPLTACDDPLSDSAALLVRQSMENTIQGKATLLAHDGRLVPAGGAVIVPSWSTDVWAEEEVAELLDEGHRPAVSRHAPEKDRLVEWRLAHRYTDEDLHLALTTKPVRRPASWSQLLVLWGTLAEEITRPWGQSIDPQQLRILPVQGFGQLCPATDVVRLAKGKFLRDDRDWDFLAPHLKVLDRGWMEYLEEQADEISYSKPLAEAKAVLETLGLDGATPAETVIDRVAATLFGLAPCELEGAVHLAQIAAALNTSVGKSFRFAARDGHLRNPKEETLLYDPDGTLEELIPEPVRDELLLHPAYILAFRSCTRQQWEAWARSRQSDLKIFVPLERRLQWIFGRGEISSEARKRGLKGDLTFPYLGDVFQLIDWDFPEQYWKYWGHSARSDEKLWYTIATHLFSRPKEYPEDAAFGIVVQVARNGYQRRITHEGVLASWVLRLRELPCLPDTHGFLHAPPELFRRTSETEPLLDVEPFVDFRFDTEETRLLLSLLGVQATPTGPDKVVARLRALAQANHPPLAELEKWYRSMDKILATGPTEVRETIKNVFRTEKLIWSEDRAWQTSPSVFLSSDENDVPGAPVVWNSVRHLALWERVGVAARPTMELGIRWLQELPSGSKLEDRDAKRVKALLGRHPQRVWQDAGHWLNLSGEWDLAEGLKYKLTMQSLVPWSHLHEWLKRDTADLTMVGIEIAEGLVFSRLPTLASRLEYRLDATHLTTTPAETKEWIEVLAGELQLIELDDKTEQERIRSLAARLAKTEWRPMQGLRVIPYLDGKPAGTPILKEVAWLDRQLYTDDLPNGKLAKLVPEEIGRVFNQRDIQAALAYSFERSGNAIRDYMSENFRLVSAAVSAGSVAPADNTPPEVPLTAPESRALPEVGGSTDFSEAQVVGLDSAQFGDAEEQEAEFPVGGKRDALTRPRASIVERFAFAQGFRKVGENRYAHPEGDVIVKDEGILPWARLTAAGDLICLYWGRDHQMDKPLDLPADVWAWLEQHPEISALVVADSQENPVAITGLQLLQLKERGRLKLFPGTYRLVIEN